MMNAEMTKGCGISKRIIIATKNILAMIVAEELKLYKVKGLSVLFSYNTNRFFLIGASCFNLQHLFAIINKAEN